MSEANAAAIANASQSMRDTAKWLVGGVAATAAGVFAGSSLTSLGSLDPIKDVERLAAAAGGFLAGLVALAFIFGAAIKVLTRESMTLEEVATPTDNEIAAVKGLLEKRYKAKLPEADRTLAGYVRAVDAALKNPKTDANAALLAHAVADNAIMSADAGFHLVRARFDKLIGTLRWATLLAIVGFGVFAWAANPPKPSSPPPACSPAIQGSGAKQPASAVSP